MVPHISSEKGDIFGWGFTNDKHTSKIVIAGRKGFQSRFVFQEDCQICR